MSRGHVGICRIHFAKCPLVQACLLFPLMIQILYFMGQNLTEVMRVLLGHTTSIGHVMSYCMSLPRCQPWLWSGWRPGLLPAVTLPLCSVSWETCRDWALCYPSNSHPPFLPGVSPASVRTLVITGGLSCNSVIPRTFSSWPSTVKNLYQSELMDVSSAPWSIILYWCNLSCPVGVPPSWLFCPLVISHHSLTSCFLMAQ